MHMNHIIIFSVHIEVCQYFFYYKSHSNFVEFPLPDILKKPCTIFDLAQHYFDLTCIPRRYFFELLAHFTTSDLEKEKLNEFCTPQGQVNSLHRIQIDSNHVQC